MVFSGAVAVLAVLMDIIQLSLMNVILSGGTVPHDMAVDKTPGYAMACRF